MRNLKRLLTMVMAIAMMMSLMVVGAGATSFKDDKDIAHKDAVEKMVSLNIINGRDDGNYDPAGIVTRGEMAKMICVALNGGIDNKLSPNSVVTASFTDTKGHWAEGYIEYCVNMGIAAGLGDNTFGPDQKVTATQAAKMLLVALGYDATYEKFTGATWAINTNKVAMQKGLYDEITGIDPNAPMSRDAAAQMIYNFCYANMVKYEFGISGTGSAVTGVKQASDIILSTDSKGVVTYQTILSKYYKLVTVKGVISEVTYDTKKKEYGYKIDSTTYYSATNYSDMFGMQVELLYRDKNGAGYNRTDDSIYDINNDGSAVIAQGAMTDFGKYDAAKDTLKFNGTTYDCDNITIDGNYAFSGSTTLTLKVTSSTNSDGMIFAGATPVTDPYTIKFIDNTDDGKIDTFVVVPFSVQKVTYVGSDSVTFAAKGVPTAIGNVDKKDMTTYNGIAKDDIVAYYYAANTAERTDTVVKLEVKTGTVSAVRGTNEVKIADVWYTVLDSVPKAGDKVDFAAVGTNIYYAKVTEAEATSRNVLTIYNKAAASGSYADGIDAKVIFGIDGVKKVVNVTKVTNGTNNAIDDDVVVGDVNVGQMYTYKVNSDGEYELTTLDTDKNNGGHDGYVEDKGGYNNKKINGYEIADNATIIMVGKLDNSAKKYTGAELKRNYGTGTITGETTAMAQVLFDKTNGFNYVTVATLVVDNEVKFASGTQYGYLTEAPGTGRTDGKDYNYYTVWTKDGAKNLKEQETGLPAGLTKGDVITYNVVDGDLVKDVTLANVMVGRVDNWDDKNMDKVQFAGTASYDVDKDTTIFNIDSKNHKGVNGNTITEGDGINNNAYYIINSSDKVDLIIVDLSGSIMAAREYTIAGAADAADVNNALKMANTVIVNGAVDVDADITVPEGTTLVLNGAVTQTNKFIVNGNLVLNNDQAYALAKVTAGTVGATVEFGADVVTAASNYTGFFTDYAAAPGGASTPLAAAPTSLTFKWVANGADNSATPVAGWMQQ